MRGTNIPDESFEQTEEDTCRKDFQVKTAHQRPATPEEFLSVLGVVTLP